MFNHKIKLIFFIILFTVLFFSFLSNAEPPTLHSIRGYIFNQENSQVPSGTIVKINATQTNSFKQIQTSGPPGYTGFYATTINATDNELVIVTSFNLTKYGKQQINLLANPSITNLNVTLNLTRSEPNVTILNPINNSLYYKDITLVVNSSSSIIGMLTGENCNSTISFSNNNVLNITTGENFTKIIGTINLNEIKYASWNVTAKNTGTSSISVTTICSSDSEYLENKNRYTVYNIEVQYNQIPSLHAVRGYVFNQGGSQVPSGTIVRIDATQTGTYKEIQTSGPPGYTGFYATTINATDNELVIVTSYNETKEGISYKNLLPSPSITNVNVTLNMTRIFLEVSNVNIDDNALTINLIPGLTKTVICNGTVINNQASSFLTSIIGVFYDINNASYSSQDDNNNHYSLNCSYTNMSTSLYNVSCNFSVWYYANNNSQNSWICNISVQNNLSRNASGFDTINIEPLLALDVPSTIGYGVVDTYDISEENTTTIKNMGNVQIDIFLEGYGYSSGDGLAMNCTIGSSKNISAGNEKYNYTSQSSNFYTEKSNLTSSPLRIDINIPQRQSDLVDDSIRNIYWQLFVPAGVGGTCVGNIIFGVTSG